MIRDNISDLISALEEIGEKRLIWFSYNQMKLNNDKFYYLLNMQDQNFLTIGNFIINNSFCEILLVITFNCKLKLGSHIKDICKKATRKLNALLKIAPFMDISRSKILMNAFFRSQFNYCHPLSFPKSKNKSITWKMSSNHL